MENVYFCYRPVSMGRRGDYTPSEILKNAYPEWEGLTTICDCKIQTNVVTGRKFGMVICDDTIYEEVKAEIIASGIGAMMQYMTPNQAISYLDNLTGYECTEDTDTTKTYCICEASEGLEVETEAEYLTITKGDI